MSRWFAVPLALVLYAVVMAAVAWALNATVPGFDDWLVSKVGQGGAWALLLAVLIPAAIYGYWPRDAAGRARRLRSPWD